jgi:hypothetical protein
VKPRHFLDPRIVFPEVLAILRRNPKIFLGWALGLKIAAFILGKLAAFIPSEWLSLPLNYLLSLVLSAFAAGAIVLAAGGYIQGQVPDPRACLKQAQDRLGMLFLYSLAYDSAVILGTLFFVVPGIFLGVAGCVWMPALLLGDGRENPFSRSGTLVKNSFWQVGLLLIILFSALLVNLMIWKIRPASWLYWPAQLSVNWAFGTVWLATAHVLVTVVYLRLAKSAAAVPAPAPVDNQPLP